jgi:hypothetical protein
MSIELCEKWLKYQSSVLNIRGVRSQEQDESSESPPKFIEATEWMIVRMYQARMSLYVHRYYPT